MNVLPRLGIETDPSTSRRNVAWQEVDCPLCAGDSWFPLVESADHSQAENGLRFLIVRCSQCGTCYTNPCPGPEFLKERTSAGGLLATSASHTLRRDWLRRNSARSFCGRPNGDHRRLLDIGEGSDVFERDVQSFGWNVAHLDTDSQLDLTAELGFRRRLTGDPFDLIIMRDALQRLIQPRQCLRKLNSLLAPYGTLRLSVPNLDSLGFRWFGPAWHGLEVPDCFTHFTPTTVSLMLKQAGFRVTRIRMKCRPELIQTSAIGTPNRWTYALRHRPLALAFSWAGLLLRKAEELMVTAVKIR